MPTYLASELVQDLSVYPRHNVSAEHVSRLADALRSGRTFPPVVIDGLTRRVIDGFHRVNATLRVHGPTGTIEAEERTYESDAELFLDCIRLNSAHGLKLTAYDSAKILLMGRQYELSDEAIAGALALPPERIAGLAVRKIASDEQGQQLAIKATAKHLAGKPLTPKQEAANRRAGGMSVVYYANQLISAIDGDLIDREDPILRERLVALRNLLIETLSG